MSGTLVFQTFNSVFIHTKRLHNELVIDTECAKERRRQIRKFKRNPVVRMCQIIKSAAGYKCGTLRNLSEDERSLKYTLETSSNLKFVLDQFRRHVLQPARESEDFQRWWRKLNNNSKQHPEFNARRNRRDILFIESEQCMEMGKTYYNEMLMLFTNPDTSSSSDSKIIYK